MPTNPNQAYALAQRKYLEAISSVDRLKALQERLSTCPDHKVSQKFRGDIKMKIEVLLPGQKALAGDINLKIVSLRISGSLLEGYGVDYECAWFNEGIYHVAWLNRFELELDPDVQTVMIFFDEDWKLEDE